MTLKDITNGVGNVNPVTTHEEEEADFPPPLVPRALPALVVVALAASEAPNVRADIPVMTVEEEDAAGEDPCADFSPPHTFPRARPALVVVAPPAAASTDVRADIVAAHILSHMGSDGNSPNADRVAATRIAAHIVSFMDTVDE